VRDHKKDQRKSWHRIWIRENAWK